MQLSNATVRIAGSVLHTVPKRDLTPAEIVVLRSIHGDDAVVNIRPTKNDRNRGHAAEFDRLAGLYDRSSSLQATPGEEQASLLARLFPGAMKKLPTTLEEIGLGHLMAPESIAAAEREDAATDAVEAARAPQTEDRDIFTPDPEPVPDEEAKAASGWAKKA